MVQTACYVAVAQDRSQTAHGRLHWGAAPCPHLRVKSNSCSHSGPGTSASLSWPALSSSSPSAPSPLLASEPLAGSSVSVSTLDSRMADCHHATSAPLPACCIPAPALLAAALTALAAAGAAGSNPPRPGLLPNGGLPLELRAVPAPPLVVLAECDGCAPRAGEGGAAEEEVREVRAGEVVLGCARSRLFTRRRRAAGLLSAAPAGVVMLAARSRREATLISLHTGARQVHACMSVGMWAPHTFCVIGPHTLRSCYDS